MSLSPLSDDLKIWTGNWKVSLYQSPSVYKFGHLSTDWITVSSYLFILMNGLSSTPAESISSQSAIDWRMTLTFHLYQWNIDTIFIDTDTLPWHSFTQKQYLDIHPSLLSVLLILVIRDIHNLEKKLTNLQKAI